jgi:hypothetical protein
MLHARSAALLALVVALPAQTTWRQVHQPTSDSAVSNVPGGVMLSVPGVFTDFTRAGGGQFVQLPNGTARLTGRVFSDSSIYSAFLVDITFTGATTTPPVGAPDLQLFTAAYAPTGSVDPNGFVYYSGATGTLTGVRNLDGAVLSLTAASFAQVGNGANNRNTNDGLLAHFTATVVQQPLFGTITPTGTVDLACDFRPATIEDTTHPQPDPLRTNLAAGRAMVLPGVANDYVFVPAADFTEFPDGHAELTGTLARLAQLDDSWDVSLLLQNRVTPGEPNHPPAGSPVLQMLPSAYVANGGTLDPAHWHYYTTVTGTLTGNGLNAGGSITLAAANATQVGGGANQTNTYFGFYGAFVPTLVTQPTGRTLVLTGNAELFGLTAVFPVLPFPTLVVPPTMPSLPTLTDQGLLLQGDNLAWIELMACNWDLAGKGDATRWHSGYFKVIDNQHVEFHPRPGQAAGVYNVFGYNPAVPTNTIQVQLVAPTVPKFYAEPTVASFYSLHGMLHSGSSNPAVSLVTLSSTFAPSVAPGIASLDIGNAFADLTIDPNVYAHDPVTGIAIANYGPIPPALSGLTLWFQGVTIDLVSGSFPLPATNAWRVDF